MATRARNGSARSRGGLDEAAPETPVRRAANKPPARKAPSQTRSGPKTPKKKSNRKPTGKPGTGKGRTTKGRPAPSRKPRDPVVILVAWTGKMIVAAWLGVAGAGGWGARAIGRGARALGPHHRRDGVGLLTLGAAIVLAAGLWFRMPNAAGRSIRTVTVGGFGSPGRGIPGVGAAAGLGVLRYPCHNNRAH